jgi:hypothetical protein
MAPRTTFSGLSDGLRPLALFDSMFADAGALGITPCTASGTANAITLTPITAAYAPVTSYSNNRLFSFRASATSTAATTVNVDGVGVKTLYRQDGTASVADIVSGGFYIVAENTTLDGFYLIGSSAGISALSLNRNTAAIPDGGLAASILRIAEADAVNAIETIDAFGAAVSPFLVLRRSRGTAAAGTAVANSDLLGTLQWRGYGTTAYSTARAYLEGRAAEAWTDAAQGTKIVIGTTPTGSTTPADRVTIAHDGTITLAVDLPVTEGGTGASTASAARTNLGVAIGTDVQAFDADLSALAAFSSTGIAVRTTTDTWAQRTLSAPAAGITITNPAGIAGNITFALANDLSALEGLGSTGIAVRTTTDTWAQRTITGTGAEITVTNGDGVSANPTLSLPTALTFTGKTITGGTYSSPTMTTPTLGVAAATSINKVALTAPATSATITLADGTTLTQTTSTSVGKGQYLGTATNDAATAGNIGESISTAVASGSAVSLSTGVATNIATISLTAGDWNVSINSVFTYGGGGNTTYVRASISQTSATLDVLAGKFGQFSFAAAGIVPSGNLTVEVPATRISLSGTTTIYFVADSAFTIGTCVCWGIIQARRMR